MGTEIAPPTIAKVRNEWSYTSLLALPIYLHGIRRDFIGLDTVHCRRIFFDKASDNRFSEYEHFLIMETDPILPYTVLREQDHMQHLKQ